MPVEWGSVTANGAAASPTIYIYIHVAYIYIAYIYRLYIQPAELPQAGPDASARLDEPGPGRRVKSLVKLSGQTDVLVKLSGGSRSYRIAFGNLKWTEALVKRGVQAHAAADPTRSRADSESGRANHKRQHWSNGALVKRMSRAGGKRESSTHARARAGQTDVLVYWSNGCAGVPVKRVYWSNWSNGCTGRTGQTGVLVEHPPVCSSVVSTLGRANV